MQSSKLQRSDSRPHHLPCRFIGEWFIPEEGRGSPTKEQTATAARNCFITGGIYIAFTVMVGGPLAGKGAACRRVRGRTHTSPPSRSRTQPELSVGLLISSTRSQGLTLSYLLASAVGLARLHRL
jgi:hypothetical protein